MRAGFRSLLLGCALLAGMTMWAVAQDAPADPAKSTPAEPAAKADTVKTDAEDASKLKKKDTPPTPEFQAQIAAWKKVLERMRELQVRYKVTKAADRPAL